MQVITWRVIDDPRDATLASLRGMLRSYIKYPRHSSGLNALPTDWYYIASPTSLRISFFPFLDTA